MKRCSTSLVSREIQIQTIMKCHFIPTRMARNKTKITSIGKVVEKLETPYTAGGNVKEFRHFGKQSGGSLKN